VLLYHKLIEEAEGFVYCLTCIFCFVFF